MRNLREFLAEAKVDAFQPWLRVIGACEAAKVYRNFVRASVVCWGCSSSSQCPVFFKMMTVTFDATDRICSASRTPFAFSPPITKTGIVNLVWESFAKSFAVWGNEAKYSHPARIRPGRA